MMNLSMIPTMVYVRTWSNTLNNVRFLVNDASKEHGSSNDLTSNFNLHYLLPEFSLAIQFRPIIRNLD